MKLSTALRNTRAQAIIDAAGSGCKLKFYTGTESLSPAGTLLATLNFATTFGSATGGVIDVTEAGITQSNGSHVAGTPTFALLTTSADVAVATFAISANMTFTGTVATGSDVTLNTSTVTEGNV